MSRKAVLAIAIIIAAIFVILGVFLIDEKPKQCGDIDGYCPPNCDYFNDSDCLKKETLTSLDVQACRVDEDCIAVATICGNNECVPTNNNCKSNCICAIGINSKYQTLWQDADVNCIDEVDCESCPSLEDYTLSCLVGICQVQII